MKNVKIAILFFFLGISGIHCREEYKTPAIKNNPNLLVADGIVISGPDSTIITVSRTRGLSDSSHSVQETGARVSVVSASGGEIQLADLGNGNYGIDQLFLDSSEQYQLKIITSSGDEFRSESARVLTSPAIDTLYWNQDSAGVHIFLDTHDPDNNTHFYRWVYKETYEYHARYNSVIEYTAANIVIERNLEHQIFRCYISQNSSAIEVDNTSRLSSDIVSRYEITTIPSGSIKLTEEYSNRIRQYAISEDAFNFWQNLIKNTEQLGSLFDLQPFSELGNIRCMNHPEKKCIGFISFSSQQEKRIFINKNQISGWTNSPYYGQCGLDTVFENQLPTYFSPPGGPWAMSLIGQVDLAPRLSPYTASSNICVNCTFYGGTTEKPDYWP